VRSDRPRIPRRDAHGHVHASRGTHRRLCMRARYGTGGSTGGRGPTKHARDRGRRRRSEERGQHRRRGRRCRLEIRSDHRLRRRNGRGRTDRRHVDGRRRSRSRIGVGGRIDGGNRPRLARHRRRPLDGSLPIGRLLAGGQGLRPTGGRIRRIRRIRRSGRRTGRRRRIRGRGRIRHRGGRHTRRGGDRRIGRRRWTGRIRGRVRRRRHRRGRGRAGRVGRGRIGHIRRRVRGRRRRRGRGRIRGSRRRRRCVGGRGCHRRSRRRRRRGRGRREEQERVEIALRIGGTADAEVDVRRGDLRDAARAYRPDDGALGDRRVPRHRDRAEMCERHRESVGRVDRHRQPARRHRAGEAHDPAHGRAHRRPRVRADVDAAMLAARVRVRLVVREPLEHRPVDGPRPRARGGHPEDEQQNEPPESPHVHRLRCPISKRAEDASSGVGCCQF